MIRPEHYKFAVIGAGLSGLAAAHRLGELRPEAAVAIYEAQPAPGGVLQTVEQDGYLIERGADAFLKQPSAAIDLCTRLGMADELMPTNAAERKASIVHRGKIMPAPAGFVLMSPERLWPMLATNLLSLRGKLRLLCELLQPAKNDAAGDESLASFARRRWGREVYDRIVQPLVGGIYAADPERLSLRATLPRFLDMEREHGGLLRATLWNKARSDNQSGARYNLFVAPQKGMQSIIERLVTRIELQRASVKHSVPNGFLYSDPATRMGFEAGKWQVESSRLGRQSYDGVIVCTPAPRSANLLASSDAALAAELGKIEYSGTAIVCLGYDNRCIKRPLHGFGFVVPVVERRRILAVSYSSQKFAGRAPVGKTLLRVFIGGALQSELLERSDEELQRIAEEELAELLGVNAPPDTALVSRWQKAMPQYHIGHLKLVDEIERRVAALPGLAICGNAFRGVGIPHCIRGGEDAAKQVVGRLV